jgi:hypothetical protein
LKLPSGREVELRRPTYGEIRDAREARGAGGRDAFYAYMYPVLTNLSLDDVYALDGADGLALEAALDATLSPRKEDDEAPFVPPSSPST